MNALFVLDILTSDEQEGHRTSLAKQENHTVPVCSAGLELAGLEVDAQQKKEK